MKYLFILVFSIICLVQTNATDSIWHPHLAKYAIGFSPSAFVNEYRGIQISQDIRLKEQINLSIETAYLYNTFEKSSFKFWGYRIKPGIEYSSNMNRGLAVNMGIHGLVRYTSEQKIQTIALSGYRQKFPYNETRLLVGAEISYRLIFNLSKRFFIEFGNGLGLGRLTIKEIGKPRQNDRFIDGDFWFSGPGNYSYPIISTNLNISYRLLLYNKKTKKPHANKRRKKRRNR